MIDPHNLQALIAVAETRSFTAAAKRLFITQPAISKRIALLEDQLNSPLVQRHGQSLTLTDAGEVLLKHAYQIIADIDAAKQAVDQSTGEVQGALNIVTAHHIGLTYLADALKLFAQQYPKVQIDLTFTSSEDAIQIIKAKRAHLGLITLPDKLDKEFNATVFAREKLGLIFAHDQQQDLAQNLPAILPDKQTITREKIDRFLAQKNITPKRIIEINHFEAIRIMIDAGLGWGLLPESLMGDINNDYIERDLGIITHAKLAQSNASLALSEMLLSH